MTGSVPVFNIVKSLTLTVVCPLFLGQILRPYIRLWMERTNPPLNSLGSFMLLMIIYTTFCDTFSSDVNAVDPMELIILCITILLIQVRNHEVKHHQHKFPHLNRAMTLVARGWGTFFLGFSTLMGANRISSGGIESQEVHFCLGVVRTIFLGRC